MYRAETAEDAEILVLTTSLCVLCGLCAKIVLRLRREISVPLCLRERQIRNAI